MPFKAWKGPASTKAELNAAGENGWAVGKNPYPTKDQRLQGLPHKPEDRYDLTMYPHERRPEPQDPDCPGCGPVLEEDPLRPDPAEDVYIAETGVGIQIDPDEWEKNVLPYFSQSPAARARRNEAAAEALFTCLVNW